MHRTRPTGKFVFFLMDKYILSDIYDLQRQTITQRQWIYAFSHKYSVQKRTLLCGVNIGLKYTSAWKWRFLCTEYLYAYVTGQFGRHRLVWKQCAIEVSKRQWLVQRYAFMPCVHSTDYHWPHAAHIHTRTHTNSNTLTTYVAQKTTRHFCLLNYPWKW